MKPLFSLLTTVAVILALFFLTTASSCGKAGGGNNNNNDGGGNGNEEVLPFEFANTNDNVTISGDTITVSSSAFPATVAGNNIQSFNEAIKAAATTRTKIFDIKVKGATGGFLLVGKGTNTVNSVANITTKPQQTSIGFNDNKDIVAILKDTADGGISAGYSFFSLFAARGVAKGDDVASDVEPFNFSDAGEFGAKSFAIHPIFWCVANIPSITTDPTATSKFEGGQTASCYVAIMGIKTFREQFALDGWFNLAGKKSIKVSFAGIQTDSKTLAEIGLPGATKADPNDPEPTKQENETAMVDTFKDGLQSADMEAIVKNNLTAFRKYTITIVK